MIPIPRLLGGLRTDSLRCQLVIKMGPFRELLLKRNFFAICTMIVTDTPFLREASFFGGVCIVLFPWKFAPLTCPATASKSERAIK